MKTKQEKCEYWRNRYISNRDKKRAELAASDPIPKLSETDLAYLAGIVDGEGCFQIITNKHGIHVPELSISMADREALDWMSNIMSVNVGRTYRGVTRPTHRIQFKVRITGQMLCALCARIVSFLRVKKRQACVICEFAHTYDPTRAQISSIIRDKREKLRRQIKALNKPVLSIELVDAENRRIYVATNANNF